MLCAKATMSERMTSGARASHCEERQRGRNPTLYWSGLDCFAYARNDGVEM